MTYDFPKPPERKLPEKKFKDIFSEESIKKFFLQESSEIFKGIDEDKLKSYFQSKISNIISFNIHKFNNEESLRQKFASQLEKGTYKLNFHLSIPSQNNTILNFVEKFGPKSACEKLIMYYRMPKEELEIAEIADIDRNKNKLKILIFATLCEPGKALIDYFEGRYYPIACLIIE